MSSMLPQDVGSSIFVLQ